MKTKPNDIKTEQAPALKDEDNKLPPPEKQRLEELETIIHTNFLAFYQVGCALREIRESMLYRATHKTFELYCRELWDMEKRHVYKLIAASNVIDVLSSSDQGQTEKVTHGSLLENNNKKVRNCAQNENGAHGPQKVSNWSQNDLPTIDKIPINEAQTRPLTRLETPELQIEAWKEAVATAPNGRITAKHVNNVVSYLVTKKAKKRVGKLKKEMHIDDLLSFEFKRAVSIMLDAIMVERELEWEKTNKKEALRYARTFCDMIEKG